jgi:hypothetical protein
MTLRYLRPAREEPCLKEWSLASAGLASAPSEAIELVQRVGFACILSSSMSIIWAEALAQV